MISKRRTLVTLLAGAALSMMIAGCSMDERVSVQKQETVTVSGREFPADAFYKGMVSVKVTEDFAECLAGLQVDGVINPASVKSLDGQLNDVKITKIERTFMHGGEFEPRMRKYGLHLWYNFYLEEGTALSKAGDGIGAIEGVQKVEFRPLMEIVGDSETVYATPEEVAQRSNAATEYFNDPGLSRQWHYYNDGTVSEHAKAGSDINVLPVWKEGIVGKPEVIVAVMDEGVDYNHEDLKDNIWSGKDDDGNEIRGYNFYNNNYGIVPEEHGTHVAGTIAAVNNNGVGVSGVAGGDKERGIPGVKIMPCQLLRNGGGPNGGAPRFSEALVWAANHGAVISQNSWGHPSTGAYDPYAAGELDREGMRYFIENAGMDADGNQIGPMAGGVIIFAAANDYHAKFKYPSMYDEVIAVAAITSNFELGIYSNIGTWVDISAPGGDTLSKAFKEEGSYYQNFDTDGVYSTLPPNEDGVAYGYKNGTSMACPHVSGVAALIISEFGGPGFTNADLRTKLLTTTTNIDSYNPGFEGMMGLGMVNASNAILGINSAEKPAAAADFEAEAFGDNVVYEFTVPEGNPKAFYFLYSDKKITKESYGSAVFSRVELTDYPSGSVYNGHHSTGRFGDKLYVGVLMIGEEGEVSELSDVVEVQTSKNTAPTIEALDGTELTVYNNRVEKFRFKVVDAEQHDLFPQLIPSRDFVTYNYEYGNEIFEVLIDGAAARPGEYKLRIKIVDVYDAKVEMDVVYTVLDEPAPELPSDPSEDVEPSALTFYPNPVVDNLYIKAEDGVEESAVRVYTSTGALAIEQVMQVGGDEPIDMSALPAGVYSVKVLYKGQDVRGTVVKL